MKTSRFLMLAAAMGMVGPAVAQQGEGRRVSFDTLDADGDGLVTQAELAAFGAVRVDQWFAATDADGDGRLTVDEMLTAQSQRRAETEGRRAERAVERLDADGDGAVSRSEVEASRRGGDRGGRAFDRLDRDGDGAVSRPEWQDRPRRGERRGG